MLVKDPEDRPSIKQIMKHPVIKAELEKYPDSRSPKISKNVLMKSQSLDKPSDSDTEEREDDESNL